MTIKVGDKYKYYGTSYRVVEVLEEQIKIQDIGNPNTYLSPFLMSRKDIEGLINSRSFVLMERQIRNYKGSLKHSNI